MGGVREEEKEVRSRETAFVSEMVYKTTSETKARNAIKRTRPCADSDEEDIDELPTQAKRRSEVLCLLAFRNPIIVSAITQHLPTLEDITDFANTCRATRRLVPQAKLPFNFKLIVKWARVWDKKLRLAHMSRSFPNGGIAYEFIKSVVACVDKTYLPMQPGDVAYKNPTMERGFIKKILSCKNMESLKLVSVGLNIHHCSEHFNGDTQERFAKLKHVHLEDVHVSFELIPEMEDGYTDFQQSVIREQPLWKHVVSCGLMKLIFRNRNIETVKLISMIIGSTSIEALQKLLDNNHKREENQKRMKKIESIHLEDIVVKPRNLEIFDKLICDMMLNANSVPVLSLQIHLHAYGSSLIEKLADLPLRYPQINLLISLDALSVNFIDSLDRLQHKVDSLKLQFYEPDTLEEWSRDALSYMFSKWESWQNVGEVVIGKELHVYSQFDQDNCIPIIGNLHKLPNLKTLGAVDRQTCNVFLALLRHLPKLNVTDLTITFSEQFKTQECHIPDNLFLRMMERLPKTLKRFSACALPLKVEMIKELAVNNPGLEKFLTIQGFTIRTEESAIIREFAEANNEVEVEYYSFDYARSKTETSPVSHWLNIDRRNLCESPIHGMFIGEQPRPFFYAPHFMYF